MNIREFIYESVRIIKRIDGSFFGHFQNEFVYLLEAELKDGIETLLDVGCGGSSKLQYLSKKLRYTVGVDKDVPSLLKSEAANIHDEYRNLDVLEIVDHFGRRSFDCVLASDVIEHLEKDDGFRLLEIMEKVARKKVVVFTPNGFLPQHEYDGSTLQKHLSGWTPDEMEKLGFRVLGASGWKRLRGERWRVRWKPEKFWIRISWLSQPVLRNYPRGAFHIFCVKDLPVKEDSNPVAPRGT